jgi:TatA/E family protein of Tat protein translocase
MLDIGVQELLVIMVLALLVFGPDKLPELGRRLGRAMREFRRASDEFRSTVEQNLQLNVDHDLLPPSAEAPATVSPPVTAEAPASASTGDGGGVAAPEPSPAGADGGAAPEAPAEPFWASRGGRLLHRRECAWRTRVPAAEQVPIKTAGEGWAQGLRACPACEPREVEVTA